MKRVPITKEIQMAEQATQQGQKAAQPQTKPQAPTAAPAVKAATPAIPAAAPVKAKEVQIVKMTDGRSVEFAGKRRLLKETLLDESKITADSNGVMIGKGAVAIRLDFRNGETRTFPLSLKMLAKYAGHGGGQKVGEELASPAGKPMTGK